MSKVTLALYEAGWVSLPPDHALFTLQAPLYLCRHPEHHFVVATQSYLDGLLARLETLEKPVRQVIRRLILGSVAEIELEGNRFFLPGPYQQRIGERDHLLAVNHEDHIEFS